MQAQTYVLTRTRQIRMAVIAAAFLVIAAMVPAVQADLQARNSDRPLTPHEIEFLENNWHLDRGVVMVEESSTEGNPTNPSLSRDDIKFLEYNWHLDRGALMTGGYLAAEDESGESGADDNPSGASESDLWLLEEPRMQQYHE